MGISKPIQFSVSGVESVFPRVIERINTCSGESFGRRQSMHGRSVEEPDGIFHQFSERIILINMLAAIEGLFLHVISNFLYQRKPPQVPVIPFIL